MANNVGKDNRRNQGEYPQKAAEGRRADQYRSEQEADEAFARELAAALRHVEVPADFTSRLMARAEMQTAAPLQTRRAHRGTLLQFTRPAWAAAFAAAALLAISAGTAVHMERLHTERRAEQAATQFDEALHVTHHALEHVSASLERTEFGEIQRALEAHEGGQK